MKNQNRSCYLLNAFSINMLPDGVTKITCAEITLEQARSILKDNFISAVGHTDTANLFSSVLGFNVPMNRLTITIAKRNYGVEPWVAVVGQYSGPRLEEGTTTLPEGATIRWFSIYID